MKKLHLFKTVLLLCALIVGSSAWAQDAVGTTEWSEPWTGTTSGTKTSTQYDMITACSTNSAISYSTSGTVKLYYETYASGTAPELYIKSGGSWTVSNIPTGGASELTLTYKSNNANSSVTCSTTGATISGSSKSYTIDPNGASTITLVFSASGGNTRIDDVSLTVKTAGASKSDVGSFSAISDQAVTKGSSIDFDPSDYYTNDAGVTGTTTFTVTPTSGDIYYSGGKIYATAYGSQEFTVTATPADADKSQYKAVSTSFTANCADTRITPTFTLSATSINLKVNETSSAVSLTTNSDGTISFACENAHVTLTGTGNSRTISANAAGEYTVNVSVTGSDTYKDAAGTITVNVTKKSTTMAIETEFSEGKDLRTASEGLIEGTVKYNDSALSPQPTVTYNSSNTSVATVAANGVITFKKAGTTTITASFAGNDEYGECEANYELTLIDTTPQETTVNISFNNALYGTSFTGPNAAGDGPVSGTVKNVSVEADQGTSLNFYINDSETRIYSGGTVTISAPTGYYLAKIVVTTGSKWNVSASPGTLSSTTWTGSAQEVVFSASDRSDFKTATVTLAPTVTISAVGWATFSSDYALDFTDVKGLEAYMITGHDGVNIVKSQVTGTVPANTGLLLKGTAKTYSIPVVGSSSTDVSANKMVAGTGASVSAEDGKTKYVLGVNGSTGKAEFQKIVSTSATVPAGKAYLLFNEEINARALQFEDEGETTGINAALMNNERMNNEVYNLNGQRVAQPTKGLYIVNGRKVVIK